MNKRTDLQNKSLHLMFEMLAQALNESGLDQRVVLKPSIEIPWNKESIKNQLWRPVQIAQFGKESTTELSTKEIDEVYNTLNRHLSEKFEIHISWPSIEEIMNQLRLKDQQHENTKLPN